MIGEDIAKAGLQKAVQAALATAASLLTDDQIELVALAADGMRRESFAALLRSMVPMEADRVGIIGQMFVSGKPREIGFTIRELVGAALAATAAYRDFPAFRAYVANAGEDSAIQSMQENVLGIGGPNWYVRDADGRTANAALWSAITRRWPPSTLFHAAGFFPADVASGYRGLEPVKGNLAQPGAVTGTTGGVTGNSASLMEGLEEGR